MFSIDMSQDSYNAYFFSVGFKFKSIFMYVSGDGSISTFYFTILFDNFQSPISTKK